MIVIEGADYSILRDVFIRFGTKKAEAVEREFVYIAE